MRKPIPVLVLMSIPLFDQDFLFLILQSLLMHLVILLPKLFLQFLIFHLNLFCFICSKIDSTFFPSSCSFANDSISSEWAFAATNSFWSLLLSSFTLEWKVRTVKKYQGWTDLLSCRPKSETAFRCWFCCSNIAALIVVIRFISFLRRRFSGIWLPSISLPSDWSRGNESFISADSNSRVSFNFILFNSSCNCWTNWWNSRFCSSRSWTWILRRSLCSA